MLYIYIYIYLFFGSLALRSCLLVVQKCQYKTVQIVKEAKQVKTQLDEALLLVVRERLEYLRCVIHVFFIDDSLKAQRVTGIRESKSPLIALHRKKLNFRNGILYFFML